MNECFGKLFNNFTESCTNKAMFNCSKHIQFHALIKFCKCSLLSIVHFTRNNWLHKQKYKTKICSYEAIDFSMGLNI